MRPSKMAITEAVFGVLLAALAIPMMVTGLVDKCRNQPMETQFYQQEQDRPGGNRSG